MNQQPGDVCVSIGTSGVASAVSTKSVHDVSGGVTSFCDATGNYLPLACTLNGAKVLDFAANMLGVNHQQLAELALAGTPDANGVTLLPYLDGERTPEPPQREGAVLRHHHDHQPRGHRARRGGGFALLHARRDRSAAANHWRNHGTRVTDRRWREERVGPEDCADDLWRARRGAGIIRVRGPWCSTSGCVGALRRNDTARVAAR